MEKVSAFLGRDPLRHGLASPVRLPPGGALPPRPPCWPWLSVNGWNNNDIYIYIQRGSSVADAEGGRIQVVGPVDLFVVKAGRESEWGIVLVLF
jgi:hypothetical protein